MTLSTPLSLTLVLCVSLMWGSWFQFLRRIGKYPVAAFMLWLYSFSFVLISAAVVVLEKWFIPGGILNTIKNAPGYSIFVFVCGMLFCVSTQIQMSVLNKAGVVFCTSVTAMVSIPYGFFITSFFGKIPETVNIPLLVLGVSLIFAAGLLCKHSTMLRDRDQGVEYEKGSDNRTKYMIIILLCVFFLGPSYTLAMTIAPQTVSNLNGLPTVLLVGILSAGSLVGTWIVSGIRLTLDKQWKEVAHPKNKKYILFACVSGFCHYGGNMIHTIAIPSLSVSIAWPLGNLSSFWQYLWGVVQGEMKGVRRRTKLFFITGLLFYLLALVVLTFALYV